MSINSTIEFENPRQTIESCFKMLHYVVPDFQREYVWEDHVEQLIKDIKTAYEINPEKEYFLGTTVVYKNNDKYQLVDGQQRMTTFFLILCAIAKRFKNEEPGSTLYDPLIYSSTTDSDGNEVKSYTMELQYENSSKCLENIWNDNIPEDKSTLSQSNQRIYEAYNNIKITLDTNYTDFSEYKKFAKYFREKVIFMQICATNLADALKIFETINQRGVTLNPLDLLKNMLFMHLDPQKFDKLKTKWKSIIDELEKINEPPLRFLRYYLTATYDVSNVRPNFQGIIPEDDIYNWLKDNNDQCQYEENALPFTDDVIDALNRYKNYLRPDENVKGREYLNSIKSLTGKSYRLHLVPLLSAKGMNDDLRARLFKAFDLLVYYATINNIKSNEIEKLFSSWCPKIRNISNESEFNNFITSEIQKTVKKWKLNYKQNFMEISLSSMQKYKIKTILARVCKYVDSYRANRQDFADIKDYLITENEIEHIMPIECDDFSIYNIPGEPEYDFQNKIEYDLYKNKLGNLSLLEKTINASIQNTEYNAKVIEYKNSNFYLTKSVKELVDSGDNTAINRMNRKLKSWNTWNKKSINERQEMLYKLTEEIWNIDNL